MAKELSFPHSFAGFLKRFYSFKARSSEPLAWAALLAFLVVGLPLFLCKGLWPDIVSYLIGARCVIHGGILEHDVNILLKPPTMPWILAGIHWLAGWHTETIRFADFTFVALSIFVLVQFLKPLGISRAGLVWSALLMIGFYFSTTEWCHCQPDVWMLLPALIGLWFRQGQISYLTSESASLRGITFRAIVEGLWWGAACLFKPFAIVPGGICWLIGTALVLRRPPRPWKWVRMDGLGLLIGVLIMGGCWAGWLWWGGGWPYFWTDIKNWGPGYFDESPGFLTRTENVPNQFHELGYVHLAAIPLALFAIVRGFFPSSSPEACRRGALLGAVYLGWLVQANYFQWQFDYHVLPTVLLAIGLLSGYAWRLFRFPFGWFFMGGILFFGGLKHPLLDQDRLMLWAQCVKEGSSPATKARLDLDSSYYPHDPKGNQLQNPADWLALSRVEGFLRSQDLKNGELTCYSYQTMYLYLALDLDASTRFPYLGVVAFMYPDQHCLLIQSLNKSQQRFVVTDLSDLLRPADFPPDDGSGKAPQMPEGIFEGVGEAFPWKEPVVYRAGPYMVHKVTGPVLRLPDDRGSLARETNAENQGN